MRLIEKLVLPLALTAFLVTGYGCGEEEQKAKDRGTNLDNSINILMDKAEETTEMATEKLSDMSDELEDAVEEAGDAVEEAVDDATEG
jgi:predicted  nucleic acid-binding Zn-ribbon protein